MLRCNIIETPYKLKFSCSCKNQSQERTTEGHDSPSDLDEEKRLINEVINNQRFSNCAECGGLAQKVKSLYPWAVESIYIARNRGHFGATNYFQWLFRITLESKEIWRRYAKKRQNHRICIERLA